jgi:tRNA G37 N-methylase Trm5
MKQGGTLKEQLSSLLSEEEIQDAVRSFEVIGDLAIVEVPEALEKYEKELAQALMKTNSKIKTVLKKAGNYSGEFRTRKLSYLLGEKKKETMYKENGVELLINPEEVYFSSKLGTERLQLAETLEPHKRVLVMFSGAGPYTFTFLRKEPNLARIDSVEINPSGHKYALKSLDLNKNLLKKSQFYKNLIEQLKEEGVYIKEKELIQRLNNLRIHFFNEDVKKILEKFQLRTTEEETLHTFPEDKEELMKELLLKDEKLIVEINEKNYLFESPIEKGYLLNFLESPKKDIERISLYDEIYMPLPKDAEHFLDIAFQLADIGATIHMYDFVHDNEFPHLSEEKVKTQAKKEGKKVEILGTRKVGQYAPRKFRVCCDFKLLD